MAENVLAVEGFANVLEAEDSPRLSGWPSDPRRKTLRLSSVGEGSRVRLPLLSDSAICGRC